MAEETRTRNGKQYDLIYSEDEATETGDGYYWQEAFDEWRTSQPFENYYSARQAFIDNTLDFAE